MNADEARRLTEASRKDWREEIKFVYECIEVAAEKGREKVSCKINNYNRDNIVGHLKSEEYKVTQDPFNLQLNSPTTTIIINWSL